MYQMPFLKYLIKDTGDVPADVNLQFVYFLHLLQTVSSYTYSYKLTILYADQKKYITSFIATAMQFLRYVVQITVLVLTRNYTLMLLMSIFFTVFGNVLASNIFTRGYKEIFRIKSKLEPQEKKEIWGDTGAIMLHRVGATVINSTDNLVLTRFVGLTAGGMYSNYALIIRSLTTILIQLMGGYNSSFGNALAVLNPEQNFRIFSRLEFLNLSIVGFCTSCLYLLINSFVALWVGPALQLDNLAVIALSIQFYLEACRTVVKGYNEANGNFVYDKMRPVIASVINLGVSIILAIKLGVAGVFFGTVISNLCTGFWREPLILFKYAFKMNTVQYWKKYFQHSAYTLIFTALMAFFFTRVQFTVSWLSWILKAMCIGVLYIFFWFLLFHKTDEFHFFLNLLKKQLNKILKRKMS